MSISERIILVILALVLVWFLLLPRAERRIKRIIPHVVLGLGVLTAWISCQMVKTAPENFAKFSPISLEEFEHVGNGWVASYVANLANAHFACAEVQVGDDRYLCIMAFKANAGQSVRVYKLSTRGYSPIFIATRPLTVAKVSKQ